MLVLGCHTGAMLDEGLLLDAKCSGVDQSLAWIATPAQCSQGSVPEPDDRLGMQNVAESTVFFLGCRVSAVLEEDPC